MSETGEVLIALSVVAVVVGVGYTLFFRARGRRSYLRQHGIRTMGTLTSVRGVTTTSGADEKSPRKPRTRSGYALPIACAALALSVDDANAATDDGAGIRDAGTRAGLPTSARAAPKNGSTRGRTSSSGIAFVSRPQPHGCRPMECFYA